MAGSVICAPNASVESGRHRKEATEHVLARKVRPGETVNPTPHLLSDCPATLRDVIAFIEVAAST